MYMVVFSNGPNLLFTFPGKMGNFHFIPKEETKTKSEVTVRLKVYLPGVCFVLFGGRWLFERVSYIPGCLNFIMLLRITLNS